MTVQSFSAPGCNAADESDVIAHPVGTCEAPWQNVTDPMLRLYQEITCNSSAADIIPGFFTTYTFVDNDCSSSDLIAADVTLTGTCVMYNDVKYVMYTCGDTGYSYTFYEDPECSYPVSDPVQTHLPMDSCVNAEKQGASVLNVCEDTLRYNVEYLSRADGYLFDPSCSDSYQLINIEYFVTGECFSGANRSRIQSCTSEMVTMEFYNDEGCLPKDRKSVSSHPTNTCNAPWQNVSDPMYRLYQELTCNSTSINVQPGYFTTYYYADVNACDDDDLIAAYAYMTGKCVQSNTDGYYMMFLCDDDALTISLYLDTDCEVMVPSTTQTVSNTPQNTCVSGGGDGGSSKTVCQSTLSNGVKYLSHANGYFGDSTCSAESQLIYQQYFVTDVCFSEGSKSRLQSCDDQRTVFTFYSAAGCNEADESSLTVYPADTCEQPFQMNVSYNSSNFPELVYRSIVCNSSAGIPDDYYYDDKKDDDDETDDFGGLTVGGFAGLLVGIVLLLGGGLFLYMRRKPESNIDSEPLVKPIVDD